MSIQSVTFSSSKLRRGVYLVVCRTRKRWASQERCTTGSGRAEQSQGTFEWRLSYHRGCASECSGTPLPDYGQREYSIDRIDRALSSNCCPHLVLTGAAVYVFTSYS
eukprot:XP_001710140.1 Hypothetical protein GL50803_95569 [Giardia lamblia ATCC 50803]